MNLQGSNAAGVIWGAEEIGRAIGRTTRQAFHLLETGQLRGAKKIGGRWVITTSALRANFEATDIARSDGPQESLAPRE
jgi:hypothetical protein